MADVAAVADLAETPAQEVAGADGAPQAKRLKLAASSSDGDSAAAAATAAFRASLLTEESAKALRAVHDGSQPYRHLQLAEVFDTALLRQVRPPGLRPPPHMTAPNHGSSKDASSSSDLRDNTAGSPMPPAHQRMRDLQHPGHTLPTHSPHPLPRTAPHPQVREEVIHNIQATYKETDLFRVFQTGEWYRQGAVCR